MSLPDAPCMAYLPTFSENSPNVGEYAIHRASGACNRIQKISEKRFLGQQKICLALSSIDSIEFPS